MPARPPPSNDQVVPDPPPPLPFSGPAATTAGVAEAVRARGRWAPREWARPTASPRASRSVSSSPCCRVGRSDAQWAPLSPLRSAPAWAWRSASASTWGDVGLGVGLGVGFGVGVGLGVGVGVGLGVGVAGGDTVNDAVGVSHQVPLVLKRNMYVHVPTGFVVEPV